jgi:hypothetical protein
MMQALLCKLNIRHDWHIEHAEEAYTNAAVDAARTTIAAAEEQEATTAHGSNRRQEGDPLWPARPVRDNGA